MEEFEEKVKGTEGERAFSGFFNTLTFLKQRQYNYLLLWQLLHINVKITTIQEIMAYIK